MQTIFDKILSHTDQAPVDVYAIARSLGIEVNEVFASDDNFSGCIEKKDGKFVVSINAMHPPKRQRFTLAHEIGHYVFHSDLIEKKAIRDDRLYRDNSRSDVNETQANKFAASILMPEKLIRRLVNSGYKHVADLARVLNVSEDAMRYRLKNLNLSADEVYL